VIDFGELVRGKSVAVVGGGVIGDDQATDIDAHDVVYRVGRTPHGGRWGDRCDAAFLNWQDSRDIYQRSHEAILANIVDVPLWVYKGKPRETRRDGDWRVARWPKIKNPNAVTIMLWDLIRYHEPASVTVYATDLYAGGPGDAFSPEVSGRDGIGQATGIIKHQPREQRKVHKAVVSTGLIAGDDRYLAAVAMSDEQYDQVIRAWWDVAYPETAAA